MIKKQKLVHIAVTFVGIIAGAGFMVIGGIAPPAFARSSTTSCTTTPSTTTTTNYMTAQGIVTTGNNYYYNNNQNVTSPTTSMTIMITPSITTSNSTINVTTILDNGTEITGMYTTLWQNGTQQLQSAFSPANFTIINNTGQTYQVAVGDFGSYHFDHWSDGITNRFHDITIGNNEMVTNFTAVYTARNNNVATSSNTMTDHNVM